MEQRSSSRHLSASPEDTNKLIDRKDFSRPQSKQQQTSKSPIRYLTPNTRHSEVSGQIELSNPKSGKTSLSRPKSPASLLNQSSSSKMGASNVDKYGDDAKTSTQMEREYKEEQELKKTANVRGDLNTVKRQRHHVKTTTITKDECETILPPPTPPPAPIKKDTRKLDEFWSKVHELERQIDELRRRFDALEPVGKDLATLKKQMKECDEFRRKIGDCRKKLDDIAGLGDDCIREGLVKDPNALHEALENCRNKLDKLDKKCSKRMKDIDEAMQHLDQVRAATEKFNLRLDALKRAIDELQRRLDSMAPVANDRPTLKRQFADMQDFFEQLKRVKEEWKSLRNLGDELIRDKLAADPQAIKNSLGDCKSRLDRIEERALQRLKDIEEALRKRDAMDKAEAEFEKVAKALADRLEAARRILSSEADNYYGDLDTVNVLVEQHKAFAEDLSTSIKPSLNDIRLRETELLASGPSNPSSIKSVTASVENRWQDLERLMRERSEKLNEAQRQATLLHQNIGVLFEVLATVELKLKKSTNARKNDSISYTNDIKAISEELVSLEAADRRLGDLVDKKEQSLRLARTLLNRCHQDAEPVLKHWINALQVRWDDLDSKLKKHLKQLSDCVKRLKEASASVEELINQLNKHESRLMKLNCASKDDANELDKIVGDLRRLEQPVDKVVKVFASGSNKSTSNKAIIQESKPTNNNKQIPLSSERITESSLIVSHANNETKTSFATYKDEYPLVLNERAKLMLEKWRSSWALAIERMLEKCKQSNESRMDAHLGSFDLEEWQQKFTTVLASQNTLPREFFDRLNKTANGKVRVEEFSRIAQQAFNSSSHQLKTNQIEMDKVTRVLDDDNDGLIDLKDFVNKTRPNKPLTCAEFVCAEVDRLSIASSLDLSSRGKPCKAYHAGDNLYRFGETSQKLWTVKVDKQSGSVLVNDKSSWIRLDDFLRSLASKSTSASSSSQRLTIA